MSKRIAAETKMKPVKLCYRHIGGKLGVLLTQAFIEKKWVAKSNSGEKHYHITAKGEKELAKLGIDLSQIIPESI